MPQAYWPLAASARPLVEAYWQRCLDSLPVSVYRCVTPYLGSSSEVLQHSSQIAFFHRLVDCFIISNRDPPTLSQSGGSSSRHLSTGTGILQVGVCSLIQ